MDEVWKEIPDWPQYEVSSLGKVRRGALIKTAYEDRKGYLKVKLWSHSSGKGSLFIGWLQPPSSAPLALDKFADIAMAIIKTTALKTFATAREPRTKPTRSHMALLLLAKSIQQRS